MKNRIALFFVLCLLIWLVSAAVAALVHPELQSVHMVCSMVAVILCMIPSILTLLMSGWALKQTPHQQLLIVLSGTGLRMFTVLGCGLLLTMTVPYFQTHMLVFWIWVLGFYLVTLAAETVLLVRAQPQQAILPFGKQPAAAASIPSATAQVHDEGCLVENLAVERSASALPANEK